MNMIHMQRSRMIISIGSLLLWFLSDPTTVIAQNPVAAANAGDEFRSTPLLETWNGLPLPFRSRVDGAFDLGDGMVAFTHGGRCIIYDALSPQTPYAPFTMRDSIVGWPPTWTSGISDAVEFNDTTVLLLDRGSYLWLDTREMIVAGPLEILGLPKEWRGRVDAAVRWSPKQIMLFHDDQYVEWDLPLDMMSPPRSFQSWPGWPPTWRNLDAALNMGHGICYFFRGAEYMAYDQTVGAFIEGYPKLIGAN